MCERVFFFVRDFQPTPKTEMSCCCCYGCSCCWCHAYIVITNQTLHKFKIENWQRVVHCQPTLRPTLGIWLELSSVSLSPSLAVRLSALHCTGRVSSIASLSVRLLLGYSFCSVNLHSRPVSRLGKLANWIAHCRPGLAWLRFRSLQQAQRLHN